ncbi:hypothetical protein GC163_21720 [bacterium]|nr:hypothetical protein [bacterium]
MSPRSEAADLSPRTGDMAAIEPLLLPDASDAGLVRRFQWGLAGLVMSLIFHLWLVSMLAHWMIEEQWALSPEPIETRFHNDVASEEEEVTIVNYELANPDDRELDQRTAINAVSIGQAQSEHMSQKMAPTSLRELDPTRTQRPMYDVAEGRKFSDRLVVPGTTGESLIQMDAALDRVTWEIAGHLQDRKVLVVWLLDASGSLTDQRRTIQKRLKRIYGELDALKNEGQFAFQDQPLLTGVVAFGQGTQFLTREPTEQFEEIETAFSELQNDASGVENVFTAVSQVMDRWSHYRIDHGRRILLLTVTDEAGDDHGRPLDLAIAKCRRYGALAYVIGPAAPFGQRRGYVPYIAPEDSQTYQLPVDLGPESVVVETIDLPFWYNGPQYRNLSSGFGPYALSRLVKETGGVYFMTNMTTMAGLATIGSYDSHIMKAFEPDYGYGSPQEFLNDMAKHPIRAAVFATAQYSQNTNLKAAGTPQMSFVLNPRTFRQTFAEAQKSAAITQLAVDTILNQMPGNVDKLYDAEPSLRWRLDFSLNYGRLLAHKVRALEYNACLAELKVKYTEVDIANSVNRVILRPDREVGFAGGMKRLARTAEQHLQRVEKEAPGTPWAVLASRELQDGFGLRVIEQYVPPPPPPKPNPNPTAQPKPKARPKFEPPAPGPPPKPPVAKAPPQLPKL